MTTAFDRVIENLQSKKPTTPELRPDLERLTRRCAMARRQGFDVELSPWMKMKLNLPVEFKE